MARKNLEQSGSVYRSALYYKVRQLKPVEPGPAANESNPPELPPVTRVAFIAGCIVKIHQKDLPPEPRGWKDAMKYPYKVEWV